MGKVRRKFDDNFKQKVVEKIESGQMTLSGACRHYKISPGCMSRWLTKFGDASGEAPQQTRLKAPKASSRERNLERENLVLKEKLAELYVQVELLKKAEDWIQQRRKERSSIVTSRSWARSKRGAK